MKDKRFEIIYSQGSFDVQRILVDKETGVHYLQTTWSNAGGLTVLLGSDGKPFIEKIDDYE